ncbi:MAG: ATP-binding protein [Methanoculleus sp.]|nr:ATP-binding protein [Methanoculleus sp.]
MFTNLIGNAVKFGGPEVRVTIRVEERELASVEDNGPGIPDEEKSYLFARFNGGDNEKNSRRLGLYICRTLIERYGGRIWLEDLVPGHPESGATIRFTLRKAP